MKQDESDLHDKMQMLEMLSLFAAGVAHEFSNPLTYLQGNMMMLKMSLAEDDEVQHYLKPMQEGVQKLTDILSALKTFAQVNNADKTPCNIVACLRDVLNTMKDGWDTVEVIWPERSPFILANNHQILFLFQNLLIESRNLSKDSKVTVEILQHEDYLHFFFHITVGSDDSDDFCKQDDFWHALASVDALNRDPALRRYLCRKIVQHHKGVVEFQRSGKVARIKMDFPAAM